MSTAQRRYLEQAQAHLQAGRVKRAQQLYRQILRQEPECTEALFQLAVSLVDEGDVPGAVEQFRRLSELLPNVAEVHFNLGTLQKQLGHADAVASLARAIALKPDFADAHNNLGTIFRQQGNLPGALAAFQQAAEHAPQSVPIRSNVIATLVKLKRFDEAIAAAQKTVEARPDSDEAHYMLGLALDHGGRSDEAVASFREAVRLNPHNAEWRFHLAAHEGEVPATAPPQYVTSLFDAYAESFDNSLVGSLQYRTPQHLHAAVLAAAPHRKFDIMDLGCGTGLCGELFQPQATKLAGVDLSAKMIAVAERRACYQELVVGDIATALTGQTTAYDLILAADVFVYIGDLGETFALVAAAVRPGGLFAFSVEAHDGEGFVLGAKRRYRHGLAYLQQLAQANSLGEASRQQVVLRTDGGDEVQGWVIVLRK